MTKDTYHGPVANEGELGNMIVVCNSEVGACERLGKESGHKNHIKETFSGQPLTYRYFLCITFLAMRYETDVKVYCAWSSFWELGTGAL